MNQGEEDGKRDRGGMEWTNNGGIREVVVGKEENMLGLGSPS